MLKKYFKFSMLSLSLLVLFGANANAANDDCGEVTIANMNWASAQIIAEMDKIILEAMGCDVELVAGDTMPTFTSMEGKGVPDVAPELWTLALKIPLNAAIAEGRLINVGDVFSQGGAEGWYIPQYIKDANPELVTWEDVIARPDLFPHPEDPSKGAFNACPPGWNCQLTNQNLFRAYDMEAKGWEIVDPGSSAAMDANIAKHINDEDPIFTYYWAPTSILGRLPMFLLTPEVPHDKAAWETCIGIADCADPKVNSFGFSPVQTVVTENFAETAGIAMDYVSNRSFDNNTLNVLLAWHADNQATGLEGAEHYLENYQDWKTWVSADVAEKVLAGL